VAPGHGALYDAFTIGVSEITAKTGYILNQERHQPRKSLAEEWKLFFDWYGLSEPEEQLQPSLAGLFFVYGQLTRQFLPGYLHAPRAGLANTGQRLRIEMTIPSFCSDSHVICCSIILARGTKP
jgi:hypothetical protein